MDTWQIWLAGDGGSRLIAEAVLRSLGVGVTWADSGAGALDLGLQVDPPAVTVALRRAGVDVRALHRVTGPAEDVGGGRLRIA